jgi:hypothetical protein
MLMRIGLIAVAAAAAVSAQMVAIPVVELAGIRRTAFPVSARAHLRQGALRNAQNSRLILEGKPAPAQFTAESSWPDGSVEWLDVDWNASIGPAETQVYELTYGDSVTPAEAPRGLAVTEDADSIQVGSIRFSKSGSPLMASVKYRGEEIGSGLNGLFVTDDKGQRHDLSKTTSLKAEIVKRGPLLAVVRYSGNIVIDESYAAPFTLTVEMPNSKTMVKFSVQVEDPRSRLREVGMGTPLVLASPWIWDFGTSRWTYGSFRNAGDSVTFTQAPAGDWIVENGQQPYEMSPAGHADPVRWGHFQDAKEVVAFAFDHGEQSGTSRIRFDGSGQAVWAFAASSPSTRHEFVLLEHFVTTPVQIGAATSPSALLSPLRVLLANP